MRFSLSRPFLLLVSLMVCLLPFSNPIWINFVAKAQTDQQRILTKKTGLVEVWPDKSKRFALIIGVDEYQDTQINTLSGASNDAKALANALIQYSGFPADQVILLTSDRPLGYQPTRANIVRRLSNLRQAVPKDGLLLVSFAGHGMERDRNAYLLPMDAQVSGDITLVEDSAINVESMREHIRQTGVGQVVIILDACRNNPIAGRGNTATPLTKSFTNGFNFSIRNRDVTAFVTLYATGIGQMAYEYKDKKQGYFTWALVEGLKGNAANEKGEVTLSGLVKYVQENVPKRITIDLGSGKQQQPFTIIEGYRADELVIAMATPTLSGTASTVAMTMTDPARKEIEDWRRIKDSKNQESFREYLRNYPNGEFVELAQYRLRELGAELETSVSQPVSHKPVSKSSLSPQENPELIGKRKINHRQENFFSFDKDVPIGIQFAAEVDRKAKLMEDPIIVEYINKVAQNLVLHSDSKLPFTIKVIDSDEVNALALPGGFLYVNKGLALAANDEAELAGAMAHLIAHIAARHGIEQASGGKMADWEMLPSVPLIGWGGFPSHQKGGVTIPIGFLQFHSAIEEETDVLAVQYMWATGYDPNSLVTFFERLQGKEKIGASKIGRIFGSHTTIGSRVDKIKHLIAQFPNRDYTINTSEFNQIKARLASRTSR